MGKNFPGPQFISAIESADSAPTVDAGSRASALSFINLKRSKGNFFQDTDGNVILDLNCPLPLGYNHDALINARDSNIYDRFLQGSVDVSSVPPQDFADILGDDVMPVAPSGLV